MLKVQRTHNYFIIILLLSLLLFHYYYAQSRKDTQTIIFKKKYKVQRRIHKQLFSAILGEKSTVARGCTSLEDESKYICDTHKAGSYVSISKDKVKKCEFFLFKICEKQKIFSKPRCTHRATAMETVAMRIGTPQDNLRPWR